MTTIAALIEEAKRRLSVCDEPITRWDDAVKDLVPTGKFRCPRRVYVEDSTKRVGVYAVPVEARTRPMQDHFRFTFYVGGERANIKAAKAVLGEGQ